MKFLNNRLSSWLGIAGLAMLLCAGAATTPGSSRYVFFISDTHFGVGKDSKGQWHNFEDARWAPEFHDFLVHLNEMGKGKADLILNGDTLELWQSLDPKDCFVPDHNDLGCTEAEALHRLQTVIKSHQPEWKALRDFANSGDNQVVVVPGNHDVALLFPAVAAEFLKAIDAPGRVKVATQGYWLSPDSRIYSEHGQQIGEEVNRFDNWPKPFILDEKKIAHLQRPWGEQFVQQFYNSFEAKYPIIDNFSEDLLGVKYGVKIEGWSAVPGESARFVWFYLTKLSWQQGLSNLGGGDSAPEWNIAAVRQQGDRFLVESIPSTDPLRAAAEEQLAKGKFGQTLKSLTDDDIVNLCNFRKEIADKDSARQRPLSVTPCPAKNLGAMTQKLLSSRNKVFMKHLDSTYKALDQQKLLERPYLLFVYSHTHLADKGFFPFAGTSRSWSPFVVNTGAWQRTVTPEQLNIIQGRRHIDDKSVLELQPEDLPACYPVIVVEPYKDEPLSKLRYWRKSGGEWSLGETCGEQ